MLSDLRKTNKKLKQKLQDFKNDNPKLSQNSDYSLETTIGTPSQSTSRRTHLSSNFGAPTPASGRGNTMLSDRAKYVRGEAAKRIDNLLHDWRDYKERADDELRRRMRIEQSLKEQLARKDREATELSRELTSLKLVSKDQKKIIEQLNQELEVEDKCRNRCLDLEMQITKQKRHIAELNEELETEAKCRNRCEDLELQIAKLSRHVGELTEEIRVRDDIIRSSEEEKNKLNGLNSDLRERNLDQKRKIELCEHDVNETKMELEILEEMVRALNERKTNIFTTVRAPHDRSLTPVSVVDYSNGQEFPRPLASSSKQSRGRSCYLNDDLSHELNQINHSDAEDRDREIAQRLSAMSTLKSLQKQHDEKCNDLADHIRKLKEDNKMKESAISELKRTNAKI